MNKRKKPAHADLRVSENFNFDKEANSIGTCCNKKDIEFSIREDHSWPVTDSDACFFQNSFAINSAPNRYGDAVLLELF